MLDWLLVVVAVALVVDRLALAAEARGWIYWRRRASTSAGGNALAALQVILEPSKEHTIAEEARAASDIDEADDDEPVRPTTTSADLASGRARRDE